MRNWSLVARGLHFGAVKKEPLATEDKMQHVIGPWSHGDGISEVNPGAQGLTASEHALCEMGRHGMEGKRWNH